MHTFSQVVQYETDKDVTVQSTNMLTDKKIWNNKHDIL